MNEAQKARGLWWVERLDRWEVEVGTAAFSVLRLPFIFRGSCQVLPMSDEAVVELLR